MENSFKMLNENNVLVEYRVLFTFESEETGKSYIVYTDGSTDEDGSIEVLASSYHTDENGTRLEKIETEKEWDVIEIILEELQREVKDNERI